MILGNLEKDSPGLYGELKSFLSTEELRNLSTLYSQISATRLILEENSWREEGVTFNPLAGRILTILIRDANIKDYNILLIALISTAITARDLKVSEEFYPQYQAAKVLLDCRKQSFQMDLPDQYASIAAALLLDRIRHHQYTQLTEIQAHQEYQNLQKVLPTNIIKEKLIHALKRYF